MYLFYIKQYKFKKVVFGESPDDRIDSTANDRLDQYGQAIPNELKIALVKLKKYIHN